MVVELSIFTIFPILGISLAAAAITDGKMATYIPSLIAIPLSFLTGNFIPLPKIPVTENIQFFHINPFFSAGEAFRKTMILNLDITHILIDLIMLIGVGSMFYGICMVFFIKKAYK